MQFQMADFNLELQESCWEELRREARKIEGDLDAKLSSYAKLGARFNQGGYLDASSPTLGSGRSWKSMEMEIQFLLEKLISMTPLEDVLHLQQLPLQFPRN